VEERAELGGLIMVAVVREEMVSITLSKRIDQMHSRDRMGAIAFVVILWATLLFVLYNVWPAIGDPTIRTILVIAGGAVLTFNTAAIIAMLHHYHGDKVFIYSLDIMHLDQMRLRRDR
jgi:hypothetical protein